MEGFTKNKNQDKTLNYLSNYKNYRYIRKRRPNSQWKLKETKKSKREMLAKNELTDCIRSVSAANLQLNNTQKKVTINDFDILSVLGSGAYAKVILARNKNNGKQYAIKIIMKEFMNRLEKEHEVHIERYCLANLSHPNIVKLCRAFQDKAHLYFVLEYCKNKDLGTLLNYFGTLNFKLSQYYAAEIILIISYMHKMGIFHRDLKPENIGIDEEMHLKLLDFGTANCINKYFDKKTRKFIEIDERLINEAKITNENNTGNIIKVNNYDIVLLNEQKVGTLEYFTPEVLDYNYHLIGPIVDIWSFGVILYKFFYGKTPFIGETDEETMENIRNVKYSLDEENNGIIVPEAVKDLIKKILIKDPTKRLGYNSKDYSYDEIKHHPFFEGINFETLEDEPVPLNKIYSLLEKYGYILSLRDYSKKANGDIYQNVLYKSTGPEFNDNLSIGSADNGYILGIINRKNSNNLKIFKSKFCGVIKEYDIYSRDYPNIQIDDFEEEEKNKEIDEVLIEDILYKKSPWYFYNARLVKLYSSGRIDIFDIHTKKIKGSIEIDENCQVRAIDDFRFEIISGERIYNFKHNIRRVSDNWVDKIENVIIDRINKKKY